jgi:hypothetical protein
MDTLVNFIGGLARLLWWRTQGAAIDAAARHLQEAAEKGPGDWQAALDERLRENPIVDPLTDVWPSGREDPERRCGPSSRE